MSEDNVEIVRRVFEASAQRDAETVFSLFDLEAEWDNSAGVGDTASWRVLGQSPSGPSFDAKTAS